MPSQPYQFDMTFASLERMMRGYFDLTNSNPELKAEALKLYDHLGEYIKEHKILNGAIGYALTLVLFSLLAGVVKAQAQHNAQDELVN